MSSGDERFKGDQLSLPSYLHHTDEVKARLSELSRSPTVLRVQDLGREYESANGPLQALRGVEFSVREGEFMSVIGPSGCGKSTLIRIIAGLDHPSSGAVVVDTEPVRGPARDRGMVFQNYTLFPWLSVKRNVMFGLRMRGLRRREAEERACHWLELVGLIDFRDHYPAQLSGGMKQRVAIARALCNEPRILLMDEPFGALDAQTRCQMQAHLLRIWEQAKVTILFITHDLDEAIHLSDRIVVLGRNPGRVLEVIEVPVPRPRSSSQLLTGHFLSAKRRLEELIHERETDSKPNAGKLSNVAA
ncbi:MAG TPA: ABC transporter ATP-binding protein [Polyangiaceae bacterium]|nr:ABC transporter ATP-binding protein [Polyangiaceae bacterium]